MNATIQEGNVGRNFGPVDKLKVALQNDGGDSFWVLEESVALENLYTHTNGTYLSSSDNVYGWSEVIVDVDTSIGMSESEIDTSPFVIDPDTGDLIDIDPYKETDYFITDPDTGDRIDVDPWQDEDEDWYIDDPFDPEGDPIPIQEDEDGDWYIEDPDTEEHIPVEDEDNWYIDDPFDPDGDPIIIEEDENGDPFIEYDDEEVPVEDWDEDEWEDDELDDDWDDEPDESWEDDDWDSDLDVDGISGIDPDTGLEVLIDVDENGNLIEAECPESIVIVTQPNKLEYLDGDSINLTGMVVTAKKADGSTWTSVEYPNGHIPLGKLKLSATKASVEEAKGSAEIPEYEQVDEAESTVDIGYICDIFTDDFPLSGNEERDQLFQEGIATMRSTLQEAVASVGGNVAYAWCGRPPSATGSSWTVNDNWCGVITLTSAPDASGRCTAIRQQWGYFKQYWGEFTLWGGSTREITYYLYQGMDTNGVISNVNADMQYNESILVEWESPCFQTLETAFEVVVVDNTLNGNGGR